MNLRTFSEELSRRHVVRAVVTYCVAAWVLIEVSSTVAPLLGFSDAIPRFIAIAAIGLLPLAALLAWFFDFTRAGVRRTPDAGASDSGKPATATEAAVERAPFPILPTFSNAAVNQPVARPPYTGTAVAEERRSDDSPYRVAMVL